MYIGLHAKYQLFLTDFNETTIFSIDFENFSHINLMEVGAELFHAEGQT
jgi:hypothetical protein